MYIINWINCDGFILGSTCRDCGLELNDMKSCNSSTILFYPTMIYLIGVAINLCWWWISSRVKRTAALAIFPSTFVRSFPLRTAWYIVEVLLSNVYSSIYIYIYIFAERIGFSTPFAFREAAKTPMAAPCGCDRHAKTASALWNLWCGLLLSIWNATITARIHSPRS